jgi:hypothetical protein
MVCQYSTCRLVSSGKRDRALDPGAAEGGEDTSDVATSTIMVGHSRMLPESPHGPHPSGSHRTHVAAAQPSRTTMPS